MYPNLSVHMGLIVPLTRGPEGEGKVTGLVWEKELAKDAGRFIVCVVSLYLVLICIKEMLRLVP